MRVGLRRSEEDTGTEDTGTEGSNQGESEYALWRRHLFMGIGSFTLGAALLFGYLVLTPHGPHRGWLYAIDIAGAAVWIGVFAPVGNPGTPDEMARAVLLHLVGHHAGLHRGGAGLDGGVESPDHRAARSAGALRGPRLPVDTVIALAAVEDVFFGIVAATGTVVSTSRVTMTGLSLGLAGGVAVMAAINRTAQERDDRG